MKTTFLHAVDLCFEAFMALSADEKKEFSAMLRGHEWAALRKNRKAARPL